MLKQAIVWPLAIAIGLVGLKFGLVVAFWTAISIAALAIFIPHISARRRNIQPVVEE